MKDNFDYKKDLKKQIPGLKRLDGFPIGNDDDILDLSNPPYYTACPNPYIYDFISEYGKSFQEESDNYHCKPYIEDVTEGKNDSFYLAHTYHTKVPPQAIVKYINHYTEKGDIVGDFFCGSGMTGVAAQISGRKAIISDLSPIATYISRCFNSSYDQLDFLNIAKKILANVDDELNHLYETSHKENKGGRINYVVWSEVLISPYANQEFIYYDVAYSEEEGELLEEFNCPFTNALLSKKECLKVKETFYDEILVLTRVSTVPTYG